MSLVAYVVFNTFFHILSYTWLYKRITFCKRIFMRLSAYLKDDFVYCLVYILLRLHASVNKKT